MPLLAIDTSGKNGGIALARVVTGESAVEILEVVQLDGGAFSAQLVPQIAQLLTKHGHDKSELRGFAVVSGPGSFTGLRVGLGAVKALAEVLQQPIAAISILEAVARKGASPGRMLAILDAGRREIYVGDYEIEPRDSSMTKMHGERLMTREKFLTEIRVSNPISRNVVTPDASLAQALGDDGIQVELIEYPNTGIIAQMGWESMLRGDIVLPGALQANYLGYSDAEIFSKPTR
jgi:tRNA threonylcarbamoyladenosine biosynthesis protein TsaB